MEQNENNKIETAREDNAATTQTSHEDNAATIQTSHEEMQKKLKKQRQSHRRSYSRLRTLEDCLPFPGL